MEVQPDLSIVVVTHNGTARAVETIRSARAATGPIDVEWLIVDSGSTDGVPDALAARWPDMSIERCSNIGFAAGNNVALARARGRHVLLLNPDIEFESGTLAELVAELDVRPAVGAASVVQLAPGSGKPQPSARRFSSARREFANAVFLSRVPLLRRLGECEVLPRDGMSDRSVDWVVGAFLVVRREVIEEVGGLDERFFLYSEEEEWCVRIRQAGWDIRHLPTLRVTHHGGAYPTPQLGAQLSYSKLLLAEKHFSPAERVAYRCALVLRHGLRLALMLPATPFRSAARRRLRVEGAALRISLGLGNVPFESPPVPASATS